MGDRDEWFVDVEWENAMPNNQACCRVLIEYLLFLGVIRIWRRAVAKAIGLHRKELSCKLLAWRRSGLKLYFCWTHLSASQSPNENNLMWDTVCTLSATLSPFQYLRTMSSSANTSRKARFLSHYPHDSQSGSPLNALGDKVWVFKCLPDSFLAI